MYQIATINETKETFKPYVLVSSIEEGQGQMYELFKKMDVSKNTYRHVEIEETPEGGVLYARTIRGEEILVKILPATIKTYGDYFLHSIQKQESEDSESVIF